MGKLAVKILILGLIILFSHLILILFFSYNSVDYIAAAIDKNAFLSRSTPPRLILVGGSNLAFGIDSAALEKELGIKVVNMGLHAGFGLRYMLREVAPYLRKGDIVLIVPEYQLFSQFPEEGAVFRARLITIYPPSFADIDTSWNFFMEFLKNYPLHMRLEICQYLWFNFRNSFLPNWPEPVYNRYSFNAHGDLEGHTKRNSKKIGADAAPFNPGGRKNVPGTLAFLREFSSSAHQKGSKIFIAWPALERESFKKAEKDIKTLCGAISSPGTLSDICILGSPEDSVFARRYFYDSKYHLNAAGREKMTHKLADKLQNELIRFRIQKDSNTEGKKENF